MLLLRRDPNKKSPKGSDKAHAHAESNSGYEKKSVDRSNVQRINGRLCAQRSVEEILIFTDLQLEAFDYVNTITAVYRIAKITSQSIGGGRATEVLEDRRFGRILDKLAAWLESIDLSQPCKFRARGIANASWSLAKLGIGPADRTDIVLSLAKVGAVDVAHAGKPQEVANTVWGLATIALKADGNQQAQPQLFASLELDSRVVFTQTFEEVARCVGHRLEDFGGQELSNTVWAYSRALQGSSYLKQRSANVVAAFMRQLALATESRAPEFEPQQIANAAWAFTKADVLSSDELMRLFEALAAVAPPALPRLKPQELSNLVWALTRSGIQAPDLYEAIAARCIQDGFSKFKSQDYANTAWAFAGTAKRQMVNAEFWDCLLRSSTGSLHLFRPLELSSLLWSLARSGYGENHLDYAKSISQLVLQNDLRHQTTQALANLAWGSARLGLTGLVPAVLAEAVRRDLRVPEISSIVWAVGKIAESRRKGQSDGSEAHGTRLPLLGAGEESCLLYSGFRGRFGVAEVGATGRPRHSDDGAVDLGMCGGRDATENDGHAAGGRVANAKPERGDERLAVRFCSAQIASESTDVTHASSQLHCQLSRSCTVGGTAVSFSAN